MFDCRSGNVFLGKYTIIPNMSYLQINKIVSKNDILLFDVTQSYELLLRPLYYNGRWFIIKLFFDVQEKKLKRCTISIQQNPDIPSWKNWSYDNEINCKKENDKWLIEEGIKTNYAYKWGKVRSVYNAQEGSSYIIIEYI